METKTDKSHAFEKLRVRLLDEGEATEVWCVESLDGLFCLKLTRDEADWLCGVLKRWSDG